MANPTDQVRAALIPGEGTGAPDSLLGGGTEQVATPPTRLSTAELAAIFARQDQQRQATREAQAQTAAQTPSDTGADGRALETPPAGDASAPVESDLAAPAAAEAAEGPPEGGDLGTLETEAGEEAGRHAGKGVQRLLRQIKDLRAENERLKQATAQPEAAPTVVAGDLQQHPEIEQLTQQTNATREFLKFLEENPMGGDIWGMTVAGESVESLRSLVGERLADLEFTTRARKRELTLESAREREQLDAEARTHYPRMFQQGTRENQMALEVLHNIPGRLVNALRSLPAANQLLGDLVAGRAIRLAARGQSAGNGGGVFGAGGNRTAPPRIAVGRGGAAAPPNRSGTRSQLDAAVAAYRKSQRVEDLGRVIALTNQVRAETAQGVG